MIDRFGKLPDETDNLLKVIEIKLNCRTASVAKLDVGPKGALVHFHNDSFPDLAGLIAYVERLKGTARLRPDSKLVITPRLARRPGRGSTARCSCRRGWRGSSARRPPATAPCARRRRSSSRQRTKRAARLGPISSTAIDGMLGAGLEAGSDRKQQPVRTMVAGAACANRDADGADLRRADRLDRRCAPTRRTDRAGSRPARAGDDRRSEGRRARPGRRCRH